MFKLVLKYFIFVTIWVSSTLTLDAQAQAAFIAVGIDGDTLTFYRVMPGGDLESMTTLSENFRLGQSTANQPDIWSIPNYHHISLSHEQERVTFTAQRGSAASLFILDVSDGLIANQALPSVALLPNWSPDGTAILLSPPFPLVGYEVGGNNVESYVYDVNAAILHQITNSPEILEIDFIWMDNSTLVFNGRDNVYRISREGGMAEAITDLTPNQLPVCNLTLSDVTQRIYFVVGCSAIQSHQALYSTSIDGDPRLEISLSSWYPEGVFSFRVISISSLGEGIYLSIDSQALTRSWIVLHHSLTGETSLLLEEVAQTELTGAVFADLSPDMALISGEQIAVYHRQDGSFIASWTASGLVCNLRWITDRLLVYNVEAYACNSIISHPIGIQSLNVHTGSPDDSIQTAIAEIGETQFLIEPG